MNRDTLYSAAVFDLDAGPVTITLPDAGKRFMSMQVIDEEQYTPAVVYGAGKHTFTKGQIGTRYVLTAVCTLIDPTNPKDLEEVHRLQDAITVEQETSGKFEVPTWDPASQKKMRDALLVLGSTLPDSKRMFACGLSRPVRGAYSGATSGPIVHHYRSQLHLGMPHTISGAVSEIALLAHAQDLHWKQMGRLTGCPASRQVDCAGSDVYASIFFADLEAPPDRGLSVFGPDDQVELVGGFGRYGASLLDGTHEIRLVSDAAGGRGLEGPAPLRLRLSFVLVAMGCGPDDLRVSTPSNARVEQIPPLEQEPDSYRLVRSSQAAGTLFPVPLEARRLWEQPYARTYPINPDRDLNGVGLLYFANYVAFLDVAERDALEKVGGFDPALLDGRVTVRRRIAYYGNARSSDRLQIMVEAWALDGPPAARLLVQHSVHRESDGRLVALASAERLRRAPGS